MMGGATQKRGFQVRMGLRRESQRHQESPDAQRKKLAEEREAEETQG